MINVHTSGRSLLLAFALVMFTVTIGNAEKSQQMPKALKPTRPQSKEAPPVVQMTLEPKAIEVLKAASDRLAAAHTMRFTAVVDYESPSLLGTPLVYTTKSEVTRSGPTSCG